MIPRFIRYFYSLLFYFSIPFALLRLVWRGVRLPAYWRRWGERFALAPLKIEPGMIWLHAVSVGEVQAAKPVITALQQRYPDTRILVTTMTPTGSAHVRLLFGDRVDHVYLPYDLPGAMKRFICAYRPCIGIVIETEIWPNLLARCRREGVPMVLANARLSQRSAKRYGYVQGFAAETFNGFTQIAARGEDDAKRFVTLGARQARVQVCGNLKFDLNVPSSLTEQGEAFRQSLGFADRLVWIAASTHEGEEEQVLDAFRAVQQHCPRGLLVLVPRHPDRFDEVAQTITQKGFTIARRSRDEICSDEVEVYLGDSMGELMSFYAAADVAYVGGSLVPVGGHNIVEPAAVSLPVLFGPYMHNFEETSRLFVETGAAEQIENSDALSHAVVALLKDGNLRDEKGQKLYRLVQNHKGGLQRLMVVIEGIRNAANC